MKLRNKKTGEIIEAESCNNTGGYISIYYEEKDGQIGTKDCYSSLAELNEEWEDYEEQEGYWYIDCDGSVYQNCQNSTQTHTNHHKLIGNYFETQEEAEKAVEKLEAWKRLKDTYFVSFDLDFVKNTISFTYRIDGTLHSAVNEERIVFEHMKTIFGGKE